MWEKMERSFQVAVLDTPSSCSTRFLAEHFLMKELRLPWGHLEFSHGTSRFPIFAEQTCSTWRHAGSCRRAHRSRPRRLPLGDPRRDPLSPVYPSGDAALRLLDRLYIAAHSPSACPTALTTSVWIGRRMPG